MAKKSVSDLRDEELRGRRVLVRADFNVPLEDGQVADDTRIRMTLPTLRLLRERGARTILLSHLGRPDGAPDPAYSLEPVARALDEALGGGVRFVPALLGPEVDAAAEAMGDGDFLVLENTRFLPGETSNEDELARSLADLADVFVMDAFGTAHRAHASTEGVPRFLRERGSPVVAGLLLEKELRFLGDTLADPRRPFVAVMGGAKISGKIDVIEALLPRVDRLLIGGAMANTFFLALGLETGDSLVEPDRVEMARELMEKAGDRILLPVDCVVASSISADAHTRTVPRDQVSDGDRIGDIGPASVTLFSLEIAEARTVLWNGPMGVFELPPFANGTLEVARAVADATGKGAISVLGGGDSAAAAEAAGVAEELTHVSTGGGASLEFLAGNELPGVVVLSEREES